ncbi:MAG: hypothetical protein V1779_17195 [bacterium]
MYEEYKVRLKITEEPVQEKSSTGCTSCRKKIAQDTFDMVAGGSQYLPTNEPQPGYFKTVEELCYQKRSNITTQHLDNAIDQLYGFKLPETKRVDAIGELYGEKKEKFLHWNYLCDDKDNNHNFPNQYYLEHLLFKSFLKINNKSITLKLVKHGRFYNKSINIEDCLFEFQKKIWCSKSYQAAKNCYNQLLNCISNNINIQLINFYKGMTDDDIEENEKRIKEWKDNFLSDLIFDYDYALNNEPLDKLINLNGNRDQSCFCYGEEPVYCCYPYDTNQKPRPECFCPDYSLKNLCKPCDEGNTIPAEIWVETQYYPSMSGHPDTKGCGGVGIKGSNEGFLQYAIYSRENKLLKYTSDVLDIWDMTEQKNPSDIKTGARRSFTMVLPKDYPVRVIVWIYLPCGLCCKGSPPHEKRIVLKREFDFWFKYDYKYLEQFNNWAEKVIEHEAVYFKEVIGCLELCQDPFEPLPIPPSYI